MLSPNAQQRKITKNIAELRQKLTTINRQAEYTAYVRIERQIAAAERDLAAFQGSQVHRYDFICFQLEIRIKTLTTTFISESSSQNPGNTNATRPLWHIVWQPGAAEHRSFWHIGVLSLRAGYRTGRALQYDTIWLADAVSDRYIGCHIGALLDFCQ